MAQFRTNHRKPQSGGLIVKTGLFAAILVAIFWLYQAWTGTNSTNTLPDTPKGPGGGPQAPPPVEGVDVKWLPGGSNPGEVVVHQYFALGYDESYEQARWVTYELWRERLNRNIHARDERPRFMQDPKVSTKSADYYDYSGSGYSRGHLVPASDMGFDEEARTETFFMSNISPQLSQFNGGIWRELEESVKDWARTYGHLYVVTGPILEPGLPRIGKKNKVAVPKYFYKVLLDNDLPGKKAVGFILPNAVSDSPLEDFIVSVDEVEKRTGLNFFEQLLSPTEEEALEKLIQASDWKMSRSRYERRINQWNHQ